MTDSGKNLRGSFMLFSLEEVVTQWHAFHPIAIFMAHTRNTRTSIGSYRVGYALTRVPLRDKLLLKGGF